MNYRKWDFFPDNEKRFGIVTRVELRPNGLEANTVAKNITVECPTPEIFQVTDTPGKRSDAWLLNTKKNFGDIKHSILELEPKFKGRDVYIVGSGISAAKYGALLEDVKNGVIIAVNNGIRHVPGPYRENVYFGCMDWLGANAWLKDLNIEEIKAILCTITSRDVWYAHGSHGRHWREVYWFANQCSLVANKFLAEHNIMLPQIDAGFSVIYSILHTLWLLQPRSIVFIGVEGCYTDGFQYAGVPVQWKENHPWAVKKDIFGRPVISDIVYEMTRDLIVGLAYFLRVGGIRLINAAQCGTLSEELPVPVQLKLPNGQDVVKEINSDIFEQRRLVDVINELEQTPVNIGKTKEFVENSSNECR